MAGLVGQARPAPPGGRQWAGAPAGLLQRGAARVRHEPLGRSNSERSILNRRRFQIVGALLLAALLPYLIRTLANAEAASDPPNVNALLGNAAAVLIASWMRLSINTYPGIRSTM
jgi:hypothetical protein